MMRIGLNATCFNERPSGAKQRLLGLYTPAIRDLPNHHFVVYVAAGVDTSSWFSGLDNVSIRVTPIASEGRLKRLLSGMSYWRGALREDQLDLLEGFHLPPVANPHGQTVMTIHDVRGLHPHIQYSHGSLYRAILGNSVRRSDKILTVSDTMKREIASVFPDARIKRIYNGIDPAVFDCIDGDAAKQFIRDRNLPSDFMLAVGHYEIRKNYKRLIKAIELLNDRGLSIPLVLAGNDSGQYDELQRYVIEAGLDKQVTLLQKLDDYQIRYLYRACRLFIFPSSYEGFGIPFLEAMAAQKPFLLSDIAVFRELSEDHGQYFPPDDIEAMADAIFALALSDDEQQRLINYSRRRLQDFHFKTISKQLVSFYNELG